MAPSRVDDNAAEATDISSPHTAKAKPTVYIIDPFNPKAIEHAKTLFNVILPGDPEFAEWRQNATAILMRGSYLRAEDIAACPNLRAIGKHGVGTDRIDSDACAARGIRILNAPGANSEAVAELVLALALAVARRIPSITARQMREPVRKETCNGITLQGKTVGIIGMGNIGHRVAQIFSSAFQCPILAYDPYVSADAWKDIQHTRVASYQDLLSVADILTIHVPLTKVTRDMISYSELSTMKRTAILINASRGGIVKEADLQRALKEGLIWGAGLDAHEQEPPTVEKYGELWQLPNVVSTPHIGAATEDAQLKSAMGAVDNLYIYLKNAQDTEPQPPPPPSTMKCLSGLLTLPWELRDFIWDLLAEEEDFASLIQTCRHLRTEILARMPGGELVDYGRPNDEELPRQLLHCIYFDRITIVAEPWYSSGSALKVEVEWKERDKLEKMGYYHRRPCKLKITRWTIRDLSSPMARYIHWLHFYQLDIVFQAPTRGHMLLALLILRAKVFDICRILRNTLTTRFSPDWNFSIRFRGGKDSSRPRLTRKSFWEMRPGVNLSRWDDRWDRWAGKETKRRERFRNLYPYFYECLMLPLFSCGKWLPSFVSFDLEPPKRQSSFRTLNRIGPGYEYLGFQRLFEVARWRYWRYLEGKSQEDGHTYDFYNVIRRLHNFTEDVDEFLEDAKSQEADQLHAYLCRMRHRATCSPFSETLNASVIQEPGTRYDVWQWEGEDKYMRYQYMKWAEEAVQDIPEAAGAEDLDNWGLLSYMTLLEQ